jgi:predicted enzyme related to lactoylglutathione lyase
MKQAIVMAMAAVLAAAVPAAAQAQAADAGPPPVSQLQLMGTAAPSSDLARSLAFYTGGLGMVSRGRVEMGAVTEAPLMFPGGGAYLILLHPKEAAAPLAPRGMLNRIILAVPDLDALEARLTKAGYRLDGPIRRMPQYGVAVGQLTDPDGNHIELVQRTAPAGK